MVTPYTIFMAIKGLSIEQFKRNVIARSGGISASNLYQFASQSPELPGEAGYSLDKHFKRNLENATGLNNKDLISL